MNVREIIESWLLEHGYDGLYCEECGCLIKDLLCCDGTGSQCQPGYRIACKNECKGDYNSCVGPMKNSECPYGHEYENGAYNDRVVGRDV